MDDSTPEEASAKFAVFAVRKSEPTPLIQIGMPFRRLMDEIVIPYESEQSFFVDGAPVKATDLDRIKNLKTTEFFDGTLGDLHWEMRNHGDIKIRDLYGKQYHIRIEALLRESGDDVTTQMISAYRTAIKPKLTDYIPNKEALLTAAVKVYAESIKLLS